VNCGQCLGAVIGGVGAVHIMFSIVGAVHIMFSIVGAVHIMFSIILHCVFVGLCLFNVIGFVAVHCP